MPPPDVPFGLISQETLSAFLEGLTTLQLDSAWCNSATEGESEALDCVADRLGEFEYLQRPGQESERQSCRFLDSTKR